MIKLKKLNQKKFVKVHVSDEFEEFEKEEINIFYKNDLST